MIANRFRSTLTLSAALLTVLFGGAGCDRTHLTASHGRANRAAFHRQAIAPTYRDRGPTAVAGLDSQESAIVAKTYQRSLAPKESAGQSAPGMLLLSDPPRGGQPYMPPPSVPEGR